MREWKSPAILELDITQTANRGVGGGAGNPGGPGNNGTNPGSTNNSGLHLGGKRPFVLPDGPAGDGCDES